MPTVVQTYLMTADLEQSRPFYESGLGLTPRREGETSVSYDTGGCELKLQADFDGDTLASFGLEPPGNDRGDGSIVVVESDEDLETVYGRIADLGDGLGETLCEPRSVPWGGRMFLACDANGYVYEVRRTEQS